MINQVVLLNHDQVNKDYTIIPMKELHRVLLENTINGIPSFIAHDMHRSCGFILPFGLFLSPNIALLKGIYAIPENDIDSSLVNKWTISLLNKKIYDSASPFLDDFNKIISTYISTKATIYHNGCVFYYDQDLLYKVFPKLENNLDKHNLVYLKDLLNDFEYMGQGIFKDKNSNFAIFANRLFRRNASYLNNFHFYFLDEFMNQASILDVNLRISLDINIVGFAPSFVNQFEMEYFWGPKYSDDISNIESGITRHECSSGQKQYYQISRNEFWWKDNIENGLLKKELEIEELRDKPSIGIDADTYCCRYIHSIYDTNNESFEHFDGAVRSYSEDKMIYRLDNSMNKAGKDTQYTKLFRIDGKLELSKWKSLITSYYQDNPLLYEYFGVSEETDEQVEETDTSKISTINPVPYFINKRSGFRIFVSYHNDLPDGNDYDISFINLDELLIDGNNYKSIEFEALEIVKAIKRLGATFYVPDDVIYTSDEDNYINFPTIYHSNQNLKSNLERTITAYINIFTKINEHREKIVSFSLSWRLEDKTITFAIFGNTANISTWLKTIRELPTSNNEVSYWLEAQYKYLKQNFKDSESSTIYDNLIKKDGVLYMKRVRIDRNLLKFDKNNPNKFNVCIPNSPEYNYIRKLIERNMLITATTFIINKAKCSKTQSDYIKSNTSSLLDDDVKVVFEEMEIVSINWTIEP
ncbi:hypothetical protein JEZ13_03170 [bacterium]|nr:hypothetical protein [bacterium]